MFVAKNIQTDHKDLIHDVSYDFHGRRMATCSSDQYVKIWDLIGNEWKCVASTKGHTGSIWHVTWAHPEFGQVIATCSYDRTALIWEVLPKDNEDGCHLLVRGHLVDSRTSVTDVKFAPKYLGLQLAMCSADGCVRIYEAPDVMNLSQWTLQHEIPGRLSCSCLSWNLSRLQPPMIAVGSDDSSPTNGGKVHIYEYVDSARKWNKVESIVSITDSVRDVAFSPCLGRSYSLLAIASKDVVIISLKPVLKKEGATNAPTVSKYELRQVAQFADHGSQVWRVSWNVTGTILASSGDDGHVRLWKANYLDNWKCIADLCDGSSRTLSPLSYELNVDMPAGKSVNR